MGLSNCLLVACSYSELQPNLVLLSALNASLSWKTAQGHPQLPACGRWLIAGSAFRWCRCSQHCHQHRHLESNWGSLHPNCLESLALILNLCEDFEFPVFWLWTFASGSLVRLGGTADACNCMMSLRNLRNWQLAFGCLGFVGLEPQILLGHECDAVLLVGVLLRQSRTISGPAADWANPYSSNISGYCRVSFTNFVKCWCSSAYSWFCCFEKSSE